MSALPEQMKEMLAKKQAEQHSLKNQNRFLRLKEVMFIVGLRHSAIYDKIKRGEFPAPYPLGTRARGFLASEVYDWMQAQIDSRKSGGSHAS